MTGRDQTQLDQEMVVAKLNRTMISWANYFCLGPVSTAYQAVDRTSCIFSGNRLAAGHTSLCLAHVKLSPRAGCLK
jgi:hypothetical protein